MVLLITWGPIQVREVDYWTCTMHPDPDHASCQVEEERVHEFTLYSECEGFVQPDADQGQQANVDYLERLALKHLAVRHLRHVLPWLACKEHDTLLKGIKVNQTPLASVYSK